MSNLHRLTSTSPDPAYLPSRNASAYRPLHTFNLPKGTERHYGQQYADMYFLRLAQLKKAVEERAEEAWSDFEVRWLPRAPCHVWKEK